MPYLPGSKPSCRLLLIIFILGLLLTGCGTSDKALEEEKKAVESLIWELLKETKVEASQLVAVKMEGNTLLVGGKENGNDMMVPGKLILGFDITQFSGESFSLEKEKVIRLILPPIKVIGVDVDMSKLKYVDGRGIDKSSGNLKPDSSIEGELRINYNVDEWIAAELKDTLIRIIVSQMEKWEYKVYWDYL